MLRDADNESTDGRVDANDVIKVVQSRLGRTTRRRQSEQLELDERRMHYEGRR